MALESIQGTELIRKKVASMKAKIQAAEKRTKKAKESYHAVEIRYGKARLEKSKLDEEILKREAKLERTDAAIESMRRKRTIQFRFREETNHRVPEPKRTEGGPAQRDVELKIAALAKQTKNIERKCNASVDRERVLLQRNERGKTRLIQAETKVTSLQEKLTALYERLQTLEQQRLERNALERRVELLEQKVECTLGKAVELENMEAELEFRVIELEDQIEMFKQKGKRTSAILAYKDNRNSRESWAIYTLLLRKANNLNGSTMSKVPPHKDPHSMENGT